MRALVCDGPERVTLREVPIPEPGPGEVLVRVNAALTCATDFKIVRRGHPKFPYPLTLGHEFAGAVERAGEGAAFRAGERVTSTVSSPCGACASCRAGRENLCETAFEVSLFGAFADFLLVPARFVKNGLRRIPTELADEAAALIDPLASVVHALGAVKDSGDGGVLIVGTGPIAAMLFFLSRGKDWKSGAERRVVVAGRREERLVFFERNMAEVARISDPSPGRFSLVIDTTGDPGVIDSLPARAADGGTVLLFAGMPASARVSLDAHAIHYREVSVVGSFHYTPREADEALLLLARGTIPAAEIVSARRPLADWQAAFDLARSGSAMKVCLVP